eukprot:2842020-Pleurochrysis_carterae.AAC.2
MQVYHSAASTVFKTVFKLGVDVSGQALKHCSLFAVSALGALSHNDAVFSLLSFFLRRGLRADTLQHTRRCEGWGRGGEHGAAVAGLRQALAPRVSPRGLAWPDSSSADWFQLVVSISA